MTIPIIFVIAGTLLVVALNNLRPLTLSRTTIHGRLETGLTFLICAVFVVAVFFFIYFLIFGMISWFPADSIGLAWLLLTILLLLSGIAGVLLLKDKRRGNLSMVCLLLGYLSLFLYVIGHTIEPL